LTLFACSTHLDPYALITKPLFIPFLVYLLILDYQRKWMESHRKKRRTVAKQNPLSEEVSTLNTSFEKLQ